MNVLLCLKQAYTITSANTMRLLPGDTARPFPQVYVMQPPNSPIPPLQFLLVLSLQLLLRFCSVQPRHCFIHSWTSFTVLPFPETGNGMHYSPVAAASITGVREGQLGCTIVHSQI